VANTPSDLSTSQNALTPDTSARTHEHTPFDAVSSRLWDVLQRDIFDPKAARKLQPLSVGHGPDAAQHFAKKIDEDMLDGNVEEDIEWDMFCSDTDEDLFDVEWDCRDKSCDSDTSPLHRHLLGDGPDLPFMLHKYENEEWLDMWNEMMDSADVALGRGYSDAIFEEEDTIVDDHADNEADLISLV